MAKSRWDKVRGRTHYLDKYDHPVHPWRRFHFFDLAVDPMTANERLDALRNKLEATILSITSDYNFDLALQYGSQRGHKTTSIQSLYYWWTYWLQCKCCPGEVVDFQLGLNELVDTEALEMHRREGTKPSASLISIWGHIIVLYDSRDTRCSHVPALQQILDGHGYEVHDANEVKDVNT